MIQRSPQWITRFCTPCCSSNDSVEDITWWNVSLSCKTYSISWIRATVGGYSLALRWVRPELYWLALFIDEAQFSCDGGLICEIYIHCQKWILTIWQSNFRDRFSINMWCNIRWCIPKFLGWPPGAWIANGTALCHWVQFTVLWVSLVSFTAIALYVTSQRVFIVVYNRFDSVRKLLDTLLYSSFPPLLPYGVVLS